MLPDGLRSYFHDSTLTVVSFESSDRVLVVRVQKEIGPELGTLTLRGVSFMALPDCMTGEAIRASRLQEMGRGFWSRVPASPDWFEGDEIVVEIETQDGPVCVIVATQLSYAIHP